LTLETEKTFGDVEKEVNSMGKFSTAVLYRWLLAGNLYRLSLRRGLYI
jgi:hypothetical protein